MPMDDIQLPDELTEIMNTPTIEDRQNNARTRLESVKLKNFIKIKEKKIDDIINDLSQVQQELPLCTSLPNSLQSLLGLKIEKGNWNLKKNIQKLPKIDNFFSKTETNEVVPSNADRSSSISNKIISPEEKNKNKVISTEIAHNSLFETKTVSTSDVEYDSAIDGNITNCDRVDTINIHFTDLGTWPLNITDIQRTYLVKMSICLECLDRKLKASIFIHSYYVKK
ncbi:hypothetical protein AGLY_011515 [Aphis glycines]|uniref:Uncharacterized protein n=1 Tax=Aphis glycines TaxID=307491 RepID=A0A6G0TCC0_APHGL|nr:hypothetical protein AGLY_011515 [Aphis glycines]